MFEQTPRAIALVLLIAAAAVAQTQTQTLPPGLENVAGPAAIADPVNEAADSIWQWHHDASEFVTQAPITITGLAVRPDPGQAVAAFDFADFTVTLIEATTDVVPTSHELVFAKNILRSKCVRSGPWSGGPFAPLPGSPTGGFISLGLTESFTYDPSTGNDLIIQIQTCGVNVPFGTNIDAMISPSGRRYGAEGSCTDETSYLNSTFMPIVQLTYEPAWQTLPRGFENVGGGSSSAHPVGVAADQKWQWHYDSSQLVTQGPIAIKEISLRVDIPGAGLGAFSFDSFKVTLGAASTDYLQATHVSEFAGNIEQQKVVRSGPWSGGPFVGVAGSVGAWVPLGLTESFVYDPSSGHDLIVQIEKCGPTVPWDQALDGILELTGAGGGNRYGHLSDCFALHDNVSTVLDRVPIIRIDYEPLTRGAGAVDEFPYFESFDEDSVAPALPQGWLNVAGEALDGPDDWQVRSGQTPSAGTGPQGDHTTGMGRYAYVEDSVSDNRRVTLMSPCLDLTGLANPMLGFWLHSLAAGAAVNTLSVGVYQMPSGPFVSGVVTFGDTGASWTEQTVDLTAFAGQTVRIVFDVDNDNGDFTHDIAIDDVRVFEPTVQSGQPPTALAGLDAPRAVEANGNPLTSGLPGPYFTDLFYGESLDLTISGMPNEPVVLWAGALDVGQVTFPGIGQLDVGNPGSLVVIDGARGTGEIHGFYTTGSGSLVVPILLPPGLVVPLQAAVYTGGPDVVALTNALVVESR